MAERQIKHIKDAADIVRIAREGLENGHLRFWDASTPLMVSIGYSCQHLMNRPEPPEVVSADMGQETGSTHTKEAFKQEIEAIRVALETANVKGPKAKWQRATTPAAGVLVDQLNRQNLARMIWDWYAIPLRCSGNMVEVIHPTSDGLSMPLIMTYSTEEFVQRTVEEAVRAELELESTRRSLSLWRRVSVGALVVIGVFIVLTG